jgi:hypothetical protein
VAGAARAAGLAVIDPFPAFRRRAAEALFFRIDGHFTAAGHAVVAEQTAAGLRAGHPAFGRGASGLAGREGVP